MNNAKRERVGEAQAAREVVTMAVKGAVGTQRNRWWSRVMTIMRLEAEGLRDQNLEAR